MTKILTAAASLLALTSLSHAATLEDVKAKGFLQCGINTGIAGFAYTDDRGDWQGFDPSICRAVAAAVFGDADKVRYTTTTGKTRFTALRSGEIDMLARNTTWTFSRDVDLQLTFTATNYFDGQGFMLPKSLGVGSLKELDGASVCIQTGSTTELNLADYFRVNQIGYEPVPVESNEEARSAYTAGRCDVITDDASALAASRTTFTAPDDHLIMPEIISKEPLTPVVRQGDDQWADVVRWTVYALINAEELGITSENVTGLRAEGTENPEINRLLGTEGNMGKMLGLDNAWAANAIAQVGNYGEIFDRFIGPNSPIGLDRGLNQLYGKGGILYAPPVR